MRRHSARLGPTISLAGGSGVAVLIAYAAQPVLSRLYAPEAFGVADVFAAVIAVLVPVGSLRYEDALLLPPDDREAAHLFWLAAGLTFGAAALLLGISFLPVVARSSVGSWAWLLAPTLLILRGVQLTEAWLTRKRLFGSLAASPVARSAVTTGWRLVGGVPAFGATAGSLIVSFVAGQSVAAALQMRPLVRDPALRQRPHLAEMRRLARRYRRFAILTTPAVLFNNLTSRLPVFLLAFYFSEAVVGQFGRVLLTLGVPLSLVGRAAGRVFIPDAVAAHRSGTLPAVSARFHAQFVWIGLFPTLALVVAGPDLFAFVFGEVWREAGSYARWLSPWLFLASLCAPLTALFDVTERHRRDVLTSLLQALLVTVALVGGALSGSAAMTITVLGVAGVIGRLTQLTTLWNTAGIPLRRLPVAYIRPALASLPGLALLAATTRADLRAGAFVAALIGGVVYAWIGWRHESATRKKAASQERSSL